ncbi:hypothetical protein FRC17_003894 [Serendipita sp. 399]|nr:hypothetical protein FRC17_003894 [Serendipita sp. 399]
MYLEALVSPETVTTVTCIDFRSNVSLRLKKYPHVRELSLAYVPYAAHNPADGGLQGLGTMFDIKLISKCPDLRYIRLQLPLVRIDGEMSRPKYPDDAEEVLSMFLLDWNQYYGSKFGRLDIEDEVNPERWEPLMKYLHTVCDVVEIRRLVSVTKKMSIPLTTGFLDTDISLEDTLIPVKRSHSVVVSVSRKRAAAAHRPSRLPPATSLALGPLPVVAQDGKPYGEPDV